jgi:hypothetical protein
VDRLRKKLETAEKEKAELEAFQNNASSSLARRSVKGHVSCLVESPRALKSVVSRYFCTDQPVCRLGE